MLQLVKDIIKYIDDLDKAMIYTGANAVHYVIPPNSPISFEETIQKISDKGFILLSLFCVQDFRSKGFTLIYMFEIKGYEELFIIEKRLQSNHAASIAKTYPSTVWFEREITDGFGIRFDNSFDERRLFLHEGYPADFHPLLKSVPNSPLKIRKHIPPEENYAFKRISGEGVYEVPVGPVHAGIIEPGHFRFSVIGESVFNLEIRMF
jgi:formate hydrogenlyase subunit 5